MPQEQQRRNSRKISTEDDVEVKRARGEISCAECRRYVGHLFPVLFFSQSICLSSFSPRASSTFAPLFTVSTDVLNR